MSEKSKNKLRISPDVRLGKNVKLFDFINLYGCEIGSETKIGCFVEIQKGAKVGSRCKISSHVFICEGVTIEDEVFIGHGVMFTNDLHPKAVNFQGNIITDDEWHCQPTIVKRGASIGSGSTLLGGITIGENAMVGAGSVVVENVSPNVTVVGNPAKPVNNQKARMS